MDINDLWLFDGVVLPFRAWQTCWLWTATVKKQSKYFAKNLLLCWCKKQKNKKHMGLE